MTCERYIHRKKQTIQTRLSTSGRINLYDSFQTESPCMPVKK